MEATAAPVALPVALPVANDPIAPVAPVAPTPVALLASLCCKYFDNLFFNWIVFFCMFSALVNNVSPLSWSKFVIFFLLNILVAKFFNVVASFSCIVILLRNVLINLSIFIA